MTARDAPPRVLPSDTDALQQQVRALHDRLAFYEGFDLLIQDNVAHARELFRHAAHERESAAASAEHARHLAGQQEAYLRGELETIASDLRDLAGMVDVLAQRVARALGQPAIANGSVAPADLPSEQPVAVVVHGVPSARTALSLQRFVASLPHVAGVSAREFAGGVLRLDARVRDQLHLEQFDSWDDPRRIQPLTERPDVIEFALHDPAIV